MRRLIFILASLLVTMPAKAEPKVIASIVPIHAIVSAVMGKHGSPGLLLSGRLSEHRVAFTPSQVAALAEADLVFIAGPGLEAKLAQMSGSEAVNGKVFVMLAEVPGVDRLPVREGGSWNRHGHAAEATPGPGPAEGVLAYDPHAWLDPDNAKAMAEGAATALAQADPAHAGDYQANAAAFAAIVDQAAGEITEQLAPVKDKPFIVFHDAYQYFERHFGLNGVGSITDVSARAPSAERLKAIRDRIAESHAVCVFREPQYDSKVADTAIEGSEVRSGILDPVGADLTPGPDAYVELLRNLAASFKACLAG